MCFGVEGLFGWMLPSGSCSMHSTMTFLSVGNDYIVAAGFCPAMYLACCPPLSGTSLERSLLQLPTQGRHQIWLVNSVELV